MLLPNHLEQIKELYNDISSLTNDQEIFSLQVDTLHPREDCQEFTYSKDELDWLNQIQNSTSLLGF